MTLRSREATKKTEVKGLVKGLTCAAVSMLEGNGGFLFTFVDHETGSSAQLVRDTATYYDVGKQYTIEAIRV